MISRVVRSHYCIGDGLLVYPVTEADINQVNVYFPGDNTVCL